MTDPLDATEGAVARVTLDLPAEDADFMSRFAAYKNALAKVNKVTLRKQWSRKSLAESLMAAQVSALRHQLATMIAACGPIPPAPEDSDDEAAQRVMEKYAAQVVAWDKRNTK